MLIPVAIASTTSLLATTISTVFPAHPVPTAPPTATHPAYPLRARHGTVAPLHHDIASVATASIHLNRRHYYLCESATLTWQGEWYAAPFYTASAASYDAAAATGPVQPPAEVLGEARECGIYRSAWGIYTSSLWVEESELAMTQSEPGTGIVTGQGSGAAAGTRTERSEEVVLTTKSGTPVFTQVQSTPTAAKQSSAGGSVGGATGTAGPSSVSATTGRPSGSLLPISTATGSSAPLSSTSSATDVSPSSSSAPNPADGDGQDENNGQSRSQTGGNENTCAGEMNHQAWAAVASAFLAILIGGALWLLWAVLRGKVPGVFTPVFGSSTSPTGRFNPFAFLSPFTLPSSGPMSALPAAALHLGVISAVLSMGAALPLYVANVPCLAGTSPDNDQGGRLGTLTDLSVLRLFNALDPSPESDSRDESLSNLIIRPLPFEQQPTGNTQARILGRALSDTIAPAISSARIRLIIILVLIGLLTLLGGLWLVFKVYRRMEKQWRQAEEDAHGVDMVVLSKNEVPGWSGGEESLRKRLVDAVNGSGARGSVEEGNRVEVNVLGVFAIPETTHLGELVSQRSALLDELELAEAADLAGRIFQPRLSYSLPASQHVPTPSHTSSRSNPSLSSRTSHNLLDRLRRSISPSIRPVRRGADRSASPEKGQSRFHEINRNSLLGTGGGRFEIGQRLRIDEEGRYVPVTASEEGALQEEEGETPSEETPSSASRPSGGVGVDGAGVHAQAHHTKSSGELPLSTTAQNLTSPQIPTPISQRSHHAPSLISSQGPSLRLTPPHLVDLRNRVRILNDAVVKEQKEAFRRAAAGERATGWTVVGRGLRHLKQGESFKGRTLQDVRWANVGEKSGVRGFVVRVVLLGVAILAISIPSVALTLASAPGFAYHLPFLATLGRSDGLGSGIVQGLVPAFVLTVTVVLAVWLVQRFARKVKTVSEVARDHLAYKTTFWLLLVSCVVWAMLVSSLEFAVRAFNLQVQEARFVADGAIYSSWWIFILLVNLCIVIPGLYILQPIRLMQYWRARKRAATPRESFRARAPAILKPAYLLAPSLTGIVYALSLSILFPLLSIPIVILLYLSLVAVRYLATFVSLDHAPLSSAHNAELAMWTIRRIGWCLAIQPTLFGLISLSRREWAIGGAALGVGVMAIVLVEAVIGRRERKRSRGTLSGAAQQALGRLERTMTQPPKTERNRTTHMRQPSDSSLLMRISTLLPGYSRLPADCAVPHESAWIDDEFRTELAARSCSASHSASDDAEEQAVEAGGTFYDPSRGNRGLVYPREMLVPGVVVWLPRVEGADRRAAELEEGYELPVVLDSADPSGGKRGKGRGDAVGKS